MAAPLEKSKLHPNRLTALPAAFISCRLSGNKRGPAPIRADSLLLMPSVYQSRKGRASSLYRKHTKVYNPAEK